MRDDSDPQRDAIHECLQETGPTSLDEAGATVLTGWVVVAEWMDDTGGKWLTKCHSSSLTTWTAAGFHHEALNGEWPSPEDDED